MVKLFQLTPSQEALEIDKLIDQQQQTNQLGMFDSLHKDVKDKIKQDKDKTKDVENDNSEEGSTSPAEEEEEEEVVTKEDYHISFESYDSYNETPSTTISDNVKWALNAFKYIGVNIALPAVNFAYKGVIVLLGKLVELLLNSIVKTIKYTKRHINSFTNLEKDLEEVLKIIKTIKQNNFKTIDKDIQLTDETLINKLKIGKSVDFTKNIISYTKFVNETIGSINNDIATSVSVIKYLSNLNYTGNVKVSSLNIIPNLSIKNLSNGNISDFKSSSDLVDSYYSTTVLPGDFRLIAHNPKKNIDTLEELVSSFNASEMFLGFDQSNYVRVENTDYMSIDELTAFVEVLQNLCKACKAHQRMYEEVVSNKSTLRYTFSNYIRNLFESKERVSFNNSLIKYIYIKYTYIDKVYLAAAIDIHDYSAKLIISSLTLIKKNLKQFGQ